MRPWQDKILGMIEAMVQEIDPDLEVVTYPDPDNVWWLDADIQRRSDFTQLLGIRLSDSRPAYYCCGFLDPETGNVDTQHFFNAVDRRPTAHRIEALRQDLRCRLQEKLS